MSIRLCSLIVLVLSVIGCDPAADNGGDSSSNGATSSNGEDGATVSKGDAENELTMYRLEGDKKLPPHIVELIDILDARPDEFTYADETYTKRPGGGDEWVSYVVGEKGHGISDMVTSAIPKMAAGMSDKRTISQLVWGETPKPGWRTPPNGLKITWYADYVTYAEPIENRDGERRVRLLEFWADGTPKFRGESVDYKISGEHWDKSGNPPAGEAQ